MRDRRMINRLIISDPRFNRLKTETKYLYLMLVLNAEDDGVVVNPIDIAKLYKISKKNLKILSDLRYILQFSSGICVVKHWYSHNKIRPNREKKSTYFEELSQLSVDERGFYTDKINTFKKDTKTYCQPKDNLMSAQDKISKDKIIEDKISKVKKERKKEDELTFNDIINNFIVDTKLNAEMKEWVKGRLARKEKLTNYAVELACKKVLKMPVEKQIPSVEESIINGWKSIYEIKDNKIKQIEKETAQQKNQKKLNAIGEALKEIGEEYELSRDTKYIR